MGTAARPLPRAGLLPQPAAGIINPEPARLATDGDWLCGEPGHSIDTDGTPIAIGAVYAALFHVSFWFSYWITYAAMHA